MTKQQIADKAKAIREDLAVLVNTCNKGQMFHLAQMAQSPLQQVHQLAERAEQEAEQEKTQKAGETAARV